MNLPARSSELGQHVTSFRLGDRVAYNSYNSPADIGRGGECGGFSDYVVVRDVDRQAQSLCRVPRELSYHWLRWSSRSQWQSTRSIVPHRAPVRASPIFGVGPIGLG